MLQLTFFLLELLAGMQNRYRPKCNDLKSLSREEKTDFIQRFGISLNFLEKIFYSKANLNIGYVNQIDAERFELHGVAYKTEDPIVVQIFYSHRSLSAQFQSSFFLFENIFCLIDSDWSYIIYRYPKVFIKSYENLEYLNLQKVNENLLSITELFRASENNNALFIENFVSGLFITTAGEFRFSPVNLIKMSLINQKHYYMTNASEERKAIKAQKPCFENKFGNCFIVKLPDNKTHRIALISLLDQYAYLRSSNPISVVMLSMLKNFQELLAKLRESTSRTEGSTFRWSQIVEFIESWGKTGSLKKVIKRQQYKRVRSRSSSSSNSLFSKTRWFSASASFQNSL